jgi:hypothetical protein
MSRKEALILLNPNHLMYSCKYKTHMQHGTASVLASGSIPETTLSADKVIAGVVITSFTFVFS